MEKLKVDDYFQLPETLRPMELVYGFVREPAMPSYRHQLVSTRLTARLHAHVEERGIGQICQPVDVVLDGEAALVVQPDIVFISTERLTIIKERVWGAPDLVVEILSPGTARRDRTIKLGWYRQYGVRECWLVDAGTQTIEVIEPQSTTPSRLFSGAEPMRSYVLSQWSTPAEEIFSYP
jgi:Uma2 family endonuclease